MNIDFVNESNKKRFKANSSFRKRTLSESKALFSNEQKKDT